ncbi:MAG TPA: ABC transporter substrate-binding protein, partial [Candidatus Sulfopaludibacter sp.]|nr:ABC transporter substrate-binding protein [Candidatus Sulfopaludibacter sp.]
MTPATKRRRTTGAAAFAGAILFAVALSGCGAAAPREAATKRASVNVRFPIPIIEAGQSSFYIARDKGYYGEENLDVHFQMGSRELNPVKTVATGQDTFGVLGGPDTLIVARSA